MKSNAKRREGQSRAKSATAAVKSKSTAKAKTKAVAKPRPKAKPATKPKSKAAKPKTKATTPKSRARSSKTPRQGGSKPTQAAAPSRTTGPTKKASTAKAKPKGRSRSRSKPQLEPTVQIKIQDQEELARVGAHVDQATIDSATANLNPGPRMQQILQAEIAPWKRDSVSDEEAQLRELNRIPVRHVFDSDEARRRLVDRAATPGKKRFARSKAASTSSSSS